MADYKHVEFPGPLVCKSMSVNIKRHDYLHLRPYLIGLETRWRPGGNSSLRDVSWRLAGSPESRGKFKHVRVLETFSSLRQVSETVDEDQGD